jgi:hypothetical protein
MKVKSKKSVSGKLSTKVRSNPLLRTRAFVYDLHAKCHSSGRIVLNEMVHYHKCGNHILAVIREKHCKRIKVTPDDNRGYTWIGPAPDEKMIVSIQKQITETGREYMDTYKPKAVKQLEKTKLEFVFDDEVPEVTETPQPKDESLQSMLEQMRELFKKFL